METNKVVSDGYTIVYDVAGEGSPLVLLPGLMMTRQRWQVMGYTDRLARKHRVIAIDPLGHGESDKPYETEPYRLEHLANHTANVMDAEGIDAGDVWGYSRGGLLLAALMQFHPEKIKSGVAGGVDLGALGTPETAVAGSDGQNPTEFLRKADWAGFWEAYPTKIPREIQEYMEQVNDPLAIAAVLEAPIELTVDPSKFRGMVYVGDGEPFAKQTAELAPLLNLHCAVLPTGGHGETFMASGAVCDAVEPFLEGDIG